MFQPCNNPSLYSSGNGAHNNLNWSLWNHLHLNITLKKRVIYFWEKPTWLGCSKVLLLTSFLDNVNNANLAPKLL